MSRRSCIPTVPASKSATTNRLTPKAKAIMGTKDAEGVADRRGNYWHGK